MEGGWEDWMNGVGEIDGEGLTGRRERRIRWKEGGGRRWRVSGGIG